MCAIMCWVVHNILLIYLQIIKIEVLGAKWNRLITFVEMVEWCKVMVWVSKLNIKCCLPFSEMKYFIQAVYYYKNDICTFNVPLFYTISSLNLYFFLKGIIIKAYWCSNTMKWPNLPKTVLLWVLFVCVCDCLCL